MAQMGSGCRIVLPPRKCPSAGYTKLHVGPSRLVSIPCSSEGKEVLGVGGLCNSAKGVYIEIQAGEMSTREKPLHTNSATFDFKRLREYQYMKSCHFYYIQRKTDGNT